MLWVWGCEEKANEKGEQIEEKKKKETKGQGRVFFSREREFLKGKKVSLREFALSSLNCLR